MDFFAAQEQARKKTRWLVVLFILAVLGIIALFYPVIILIWYWAISKSVEQLPPFWDIERFLWIGLFMGGWIAAVSLFKMWQISRQGGRLIAEQLGGHMIARDTADPAEKRLLNVVDEMSIAAGIPAPVAFVLPEEPSLNAFAAGLSPRDSVVAVTRGLLETMNRDELQGVIGHEISHIVNGDSRLNIKLIGVLFGIHAFTIFGRALMQARGRNAGAAIMMGFGFFLAGSIGVFFGRLIQAMVSREREFLADASAVQFTRHPNGLASALNRLRSVGSQIENPYATSASHLFFGTDGKPVSAKSWASLLATHPPLQERIRRIGTIFLSSPGLEQPEPEKGKAAEASLRTLDMSGVEANRPLVMTANPHAAISVAPPIALPAIMMGGADVSASVAEAQSLLDGLPEALRQQASTVTGASGIVCGLLFASQNDIRLQQEKLLPPAMLPAAQELSLWLASQPEQGARYRLVWLDLALPTLRGAWAGKCSRYPWQEGATLSPLKSEPATERQQLFDLVKELIRADGRISPSEFAIYSILQNTLLSPSERPDKSELRPDRLDSDIASLLALMAYAGHADGEMAKAAYQAALAASPAGKELPFPDRKDFSLKTVSKAFGHLALATPPYRKKILEACAVAAEHDGKITPVENELLRAFAQSLDCPAPLVAQPS